MYSKHALTDGYFKGFVSGWAMILFLTTSNGNEHIQNVVAAIPPATNGCQDELIEVSLSDFVVKK